ncbi:MAG TPA: response regulator transcription factor, partial [Candidatus Aminicenantes bacterium]|nr:response regulator transcription factor [Candidatus Aminicenantes bacterium]
HQIVRQGIKNLLEQEKNIEVVGECGDGHSAIELTATLAPDVVVMDISLPGLNGIDATREIVAQSPARRVLALSMHADKRFLSGILEAGAVGFLPKDCAYTELVTAIRVVHAGQVYLSPAISQVVVNDYRNRLSGADFAELTVREREILQRIAEGRSAKEIAADLGLSQKTVETHRQKIMEKLDLYSVAELTKYAVREGITSL